MKLHLDYYQQKYRSDRRDPILNWLSQFHYCQIIVCKAITTWFNISFIISKVGDLNRGWPEGSLFNSYDTKV